ncbi:MAG: VWA domain-containing protein [Bryobacteraceae bacterium]
MRKTPRKGRRSRGFAIILTALMLTFIVPLVGLAIDGGILYSVRARLSAASDAAAMASARALATGLTIQEQEASAVARAQAYFAANFPSGSFDTSNPTVGAVVQEVNLVTRRVTVNAGVTPPVYFMRYLGWGSGSKTLRVNVTGQASRRDINLMMVIDRSGSLQTAGACDDLETAAQAFTALFANQRDRLGLITYGGSYRLDYAPTKDFKTSPTLNSEIDKLFPGGCSGWTGSAQGLWQGYQQLVTLDEPGRLNVILFFTDGQPNTVTNDWPLDVNGTPGNSDMTRCYDWEHGKKYNQWGYDPSNLKYRGYIAQDIGSGNTDGIRGHEANAMPTDDPGKVSIPVGYSGTPKSTSDDCWFRTTNSINSIVERDVPYYPDTDFYGNSMFGFKSVNTWSSGPYSGKVRYQSGLTGLNASINALDSAALRIRQKVGNPNLTTMIYAIGLGGVGEAESDILERVANDRDSAIFDNNSPEGLYVYAPNPAALNEAFVRIASEILRYSL